MHKSNSTKVGKTLLNHCIDQGGGGDVSKREMYILFFSKIVWKFKKKKKKKKKKGGREGGLFQIYNISFVTKYLKNIISGGGMY